MGACPSNIIPFSAKKADLCLFHFPVLLTFQDCNLEKYDNELPSLVLTYSQKILFDKSNHPGRILFFSCIRQAQFSSIKAVSILNGFFHINGKRSCRQIAFCPVS